MTVLKQYNTSTSTWDTVVVGQPGEPGIVTASTAPADTSVLWMDTADTASQVAVPSGGTAGQILAKTTGVDYATGWVDNTDNRNVIINGGFDIWQRGTSFTPAVNTLVYTADRWYAQRDGSGSTVTVSRQAFTPGSAPVSGYEGQYYARFSQTVAGTGGTYNVFDQRIEDVRTFAGQTVTLSFWAKADSAKTIDVNFTQYYGSGGSGYGGVPFGSASLTTSWQRYTLTTTQQSITGKTIGPDSWGLVEFLFPKNVVQTIDIWGVQLEAGSAATPFKRNAPSIQAELAACQRYYQRITTTPGINDYGMYCMGYATSSTAGVLMYQLPTSMRTVPQSIEGSNLKVFDSGASGTTSPTLTISVVEGNASMAKINVTGSGFTAHRVISLSNFNNTLASYVGFSAELQ